MANLNQLPLKQTKPRQYRYFSEELKQKLVKDLEKRLISMAELCREYQVNRSAVYKWVHRYSILMKKNVRVVVESKSTTKKLINQAERIKELEQMLGQLTAKNFYLEKLIELAEKDLGISIKKKEKK